MPINNMKDDLEYILLSEEQIQKRVREIAAAISEDYKDKELLLVCILKGASVFFADLARRITVPCQFDFMSLSSYHNGAVSSGKVDLRKDLSVDIAGRHVLLVEDIIDTGLSLSTLRESLQKRNPASLRLCALLDKPDCHKADLPVEYKGFTIPNAFVVGYGLDYAEHYRNLPDVAVLKPDVYIH